MYISRLIAIWGVALALGLPLAAHAAYDSADAAQEKTLEIIRVTPDGDDVPVGKQLVIQFNRPVVPIGAMERNASDIPVIISPAIDCEWRWINTSALACNLPDTAPLQESTRYTVDIKPGIKAEDGTTIAQTYQHSFITRRPNLDYKNFAYWKSPGLPVLRLVFNQPVDKESLSQHVFYAVGAQGTRVSIKVRPDPEDNTPPRFIPVPGEKYGLLFNKLTARKSDDALVRRNGREARRIWLVEPTQELPPDTHLVLKTEPGLISALGPQPSVSSEEIVQLDTYPEFRFLGLLCMSNTGQQLTIPAGQVIEGKCNPQQPVQLSFNTPVRRDQVGDMVTFTPPVGGWKKAADDADEEGVYDEDDTSNIGYEYRQSHTKDRTYQVWLPAGLKAAQQYSMQSHAQTLSLFGRIKYWVRSLFTNVPPITVTDIFGREAQNTIDARFTTDHRNPNFVLDYDDAVLEKNVADSEVPLFVNNLDRYRFDYRRVDATGSAASEVFERTVPNVKDVQFAVPLGVREMLNGKSGALFGTLSTQPKIDRYSPAQLFAQVTPYQVHLKLGHFSSLAWVTDMSSGEPVANANVSFYKDAFTTLNPMKAATAQATTDALGMAVLPGTNTLDPTLEITRRYARGDTRYFLRVQKGDDMALLPVHYSYLIDSYRSSGSEAVYPSNKERYGHMRAWGTTAQGIYRAGDTVQYKIMVRNQDNSQFVQPPHQGYRLKIIDPMGKVVSDQKDMTLSTFGSISGAFTVPKEGAVGWYQFKLVADFSGKPQKDDEEASDDGSNGYGEDNNDNADRKIFLPMRVLVSDFTPASFRVTNQLNGDLFHAGQNVEVTTRAELHSGGAYTDASARITALLDSAPFVSSHPLTKNFQFDSYQHESPSQQLFQKIDAVNDKGELALSFSTGTPKIVYGKLLVESAVADDRGKYISGQSRVDYIGVDRLVGLHAEDWLFQAGKPAIVQYAVVDARGRPVKDTEVNIAIEHQVTKAARVKGAGNAYLTEYTSAWESAGSCRGVSQEAPSDCSFTPAKSGVYRAIAKIKDTKGNEHSTTLSNYAVGSDFVMWNDESDTALTIVPESTDYKVGDTARYLVKNPYPGAKALITIERYGVIDRFVQTFDSSTPIVEFPVKPDYLPGFYLSVVVTSPRVEKPLGEGQVDLGKPTFRMGYVAVPVRDQTKEVLVTAKTDKPVYKPRETVTVQLHAEPRLKDKQEPIELTITVLDESVFDLIAGGKNYFNPYMGFYILESLDLRNYSLLTRLVGRQKFEKKGANPGGDGGADLSIRSLFKFVSYWNAELKTDSAGNATVTFEAPDNLTGWRILAMAATPTDRFGLGDANFKVNRPTEIRPVMPNQVMEGDTFQAGFSVMNRTDKPRTIDVVAKAEGDVKGTLPLIVKKTITLAAYKRDIVYLPITANALPLSRDAPKGEITFTVSAGDATDRDGLETHVPVHKRRSLDVAANYGTTTKDSITETIQFPDRILPDVGSVSVVASPTVIGNISGAFTYMRDYPYPCWEQKLSKGVMAAHYKNLKPYLPDALTWKGSDDLAQETLDQAASFQAPNGGMTYLVAQDMYVDPYLSAYTALAFNWLRHDGYTIPEQVENKLHTYLSELLKNDDVPDFYSEGMTSTVRAVALAALAQRGKADLADLERYEPHVKNMSLFGKSHFLQATLAIDGGEKYASAVANAMLASSNQTGGKFVFNETWDDSYTRILASPLRENCAVLSAFTAFGEMPDGAKLVGDVPFKLVRSITQSRQNRDHWENTQENMFCMNALIDFARVYENEKPDMTVTAALDNTSFGETAFHDVRDPAATLERPIQPGDAGRSVPLTIKREGDGRLYYATRLAYALPVEETKAANAGMEIHREYSVQRDGKWELLDAQSPVKRGELVRVDLYLSVPAARNFVVLDDAVPGGLEPVNRDLATTSEVDAREGDFAAAKDSFWFKFSDWIDFGVSRWSFYHHELRHDSVRFYSDYLPAGNYHLSYAAQAIATGSFSALPAIAQEMYEPDVYGKTVARMLQVDDADPAPTASH